MKTTDKNIRTKQIGKSDGRLIKRIKLNENENENENIFKLSQMAQIIFKETKPLPPCITSLWSGLLCNLKVFKKSFQD